MKARSLATLREVRDSLIGLDVIVKPEIGEVLRQAIVLLYVVLTMEKV